jgi:hypothetical protein
MVFPIGDRTLSHGQSLPRCEPKTQPWSESRICRLHLALDVTDVGALSRFVALGRSSHVDRRLFEQRTDKANTYRALSFAVALYRTPCAVELAFTTMRSYTG